MLNNHFVVGLVVLVAGMLLWEIKSILIVVFISYIFMAAMTPGVNFLVRIRFPKIVATLVTYFFGLGIIVLLVVPLVPFLARQFGELIERFPFYLERAGEALGLAPASLSLANILQAEVDVIGKNAVTLTGRVFGGFFSTIAVAVLSLYMLLDKSRIHRTLDRFVSLGKLEAVEEKLGMWFRGQMLLCFSIGFASWLALTVLGLPFASSLAIIAGLLEVIPTIGPIVSAIPAVIVALTISPTLALLVVIVYLVIQLLENNLLVPKIMQKVVGLDPVAVIIGIMVGGELMGFMGALLAVPFILVLSVVIKKQ